jgi:hypothetical protein
VQEAEEIGRCKICNPSLDRILYDRVLVHEKNSSSTRGESSTTAPGNIFGSTYHR